MHPKYQEVIKLRFKGKSYREMAKATGVSKSSVSGWCKNLKLPPAIQRLIKTKTRASHAQLAFYNRQKHLRVQAENKEIRENAIKQISFLSRRELLLIGATLYWAEGYKRQDKIPSPRVSFVNSDYGMVILFMRFLREIVDVPDERLRPSIRIHPNISERKAVNFWSKVTNLSKDRFCITRQISRASKRKRPYNSLPYGTLDLRVNSRQKFFQIMGWIDGLIQQNI